jgi:hypothetical protein
VQTASLAEAVNLDLPQYPLIVLNNPGDLEQQVTNRLTDYVTKGGSIMIAAGPATCRAGVIPIAGNQIAQTRDTQGASTNPAGIFGEAFNNVQFLSTPLITAKPGDRIVARFSNGSPLLIEQTQGEGKLLIFASTLDNSTSDFPIHASFVPFVAATSQYLSGSTDDPSSVVVGSAVALRQSRNQSASADVIGPEGKHEIPLSEATRIMSFNPTREGFYEIHAASGKRQLLAVHADRRESNLAKVPAETLILWRNTSNGVVTASTAVADSTVVQVSLWRYVLTFLLIAAIVESIFASRYLSEERQAS